MENAKVTENTINIFSSILEMLFYLHYQKYYRDKETPGWNYCITTIEDSYVPLPPCIY